jgi:hypothetical protein
MSGERRGDEERIEGAKDERGGKGRKGGRQRR